MQKIDGSVRNIHTHASAGLIVNHCAVVMSPKGKVRGAGHVTPEIFFSLSATVLKLGAEIGSSGPQTITIRQRRLRRLKMHKVSWVVKNSRFKPHI